jgi:RNA binding exosome subunit
MNKRLKDKKLLSGMIVTGGFLIILAGGALTQQTALGQSYQGVYIDGIFVGYVAENVDVKEAIRKARRELAAESEKRLCMDYEWSVKTEKKPFVHLEKKEALEEQLKNVLSEKTIESRERAYTVAIGSYRGNFTTIDEVTDFLNQVRKKADEEDAYTVTYQSLEGQIDGILTADLKQKESEDDLAKEGEKETQDIQASSLAGVSLESATQLLDAVTSDAADFYETGVFDICGKC